MEQYVSFELSFITVGTPEKVYKFHTQVVTLSDDHLKLVIFPNNQILFLFYTLKS